MSVWTSLPILTEFRFRHGEAVRSRVPLRKCREARQVIRPRAGPPRRCALILTQARALPVIEGVGIGRIQVYRSRNSLWITRSHRTHFQTGKGMSNQDWFGELERVQHRHYIVAQPI